MKSDASCHKIYKTVEALLKEEEKTKYCTMPLALPYYSPKKKAQTIPHLTMSFGTSEPKKEGHGC